MKIKLLSSVMLVFFINACGKNSANPGCGININEQANAQTIGILFIGNSHTFYNELPDLVKLIAQSVGDSVYTEMSAPGGYDFERHHTLPATISALNSRKWDYIVLQESGWKSAFHTSMAERAIYPFADSLKKQIVYHNPTAKLILYMTNGYADGVNTFGDTAWCRTDPPVCTLEGMQDRIKTNYIHLAQQLNAEVAPCGLIWKALQSRNPNLVLYDADGIHPSLAGSYVNAVTIYSLVRKQPMKDIFIPAGVSNEHAALVQNTVANILFYCNPAWKDL
jgi:hypothetical protein